MWYRGSRGEEEKSRRIMGASAARSTYNQSQKSIDGICPVLTLTLHASPVYARTRHDNIMHNGKDAFTAYPIALLVFDLAVVQDCSFVELYPSTMYCSSEWNLVGVKVFPAGFTNYLFWRVP